MPGDRAFVALIADQPLFDEQGDGLARLGLVKPLSDQIGGDLGSRGVVSGDSFSFTLESL
jgi:hypothetical protein